MLFFRFHHFARLQTLSHVLRASINLHSKQRDPARLSVSNTTMRGSFLGVVLSFLVATAVIAAPLSPYVEEAGRDVAGKSNEIDDLVEAMSRLPRLKTSPQGSRIVSSEEEANAPRFAGSSQPNAWSSVPMAGKRTRVSEAESSRTSRTRQ